MIRLLRKFVTALKNPRHDAIYTGSDGEVHVEPRQRYTRGRRDLPTPPPGVPF